MLTKVAAPRINTNDNKVEVVAWHVADDEFVEVGQEIADLETSKAVVTINAELSGHIRCLAKPGSVIKVGDPLYLLADSVQELTEQAPAGSAAEDAAPAAPLPGGAAPGAGHGVTRFSDAALRFIKDKGWSEDRFQGAGLVTLAMLAPPAPGAKAAKGKAVQRPLSGAAVPPLAPGLRIESVSLAKNAEIDCLSIGESGNINSMLTVQFPSEGIRRRLHQDGLFDGNIQPLILFEIARLLRQWPQLTAFFDNDSVHYYDRVDLGLAFDMGKGLKVVTIQEADKLMPRDFFERTIEIGLRYMENRILPEELVGSTFTVTDLSGLDILVFHPLINGHQSAILGIGGDSFQPGHPMSLNLTFDHRVTNGREVALFLNELRKRLTSYAIADQPPPRAASAAQADGLMAGSKVHNCDACGIGLADYMETFGRDAYLVPYFRADGSLGGVCHRCLGGV